MPDIRRASALPHGNTPPLSVAEAAESIEHKLSKGRSDLFEPIPVGFDGIDRCLNGGLHGGDLALLGGAQNVGKTAAMLQMAKSVAMNKGLAIVVCYEHTETELWERLLIQSSFVDNPGDHVTANKLREAYIDVVSLRERIAEEDDRFKHMNKVVSRLPNGAVAWGRLNELDERIWLIRGNALTTDDKALEAYVVLANSYHFDKIVLFVDYMQRMPTFSLGGRVMTIEERIEHNTRALKNLALKFTSQGGWLSVLAVAAADAESLRSGRVHMENLWGNAIVQYEPDIGLIMNKDERDKDGNVVVRWGVEKNRHGPSDVEFKHIFHGSAYTFSSDGEEVADDESWQSERRTVKDVV